jgi:hypothetical protein
VLVGDQEVTLEVILQRQPILNAADVVTQVQATGWSITSEDARFGRHRWSYSGWSK